EEQVDLKIVKRFVFGPKTYTVANGPHFLVAKECLNLRAASEPWRLQFFAHLQNRICYGLHSSFGGSFFHDDQDVGSIELRVRALHNSQNDPFFSILNAKAVSNLIGIEGRPKVLACSHQPTAGQLHCVNVCKPHTAILTAEIAPRNTLELKRNR